MIYGFTGTQYGLTEEQALALYAYARANFKGSWFHHGDCIGADAEAHDIAQAAGAHVVIHPPRIETKRAFCEGALRVHRPQDYLQRNMDIVSSCDLLIACPKGYREERRSGTWATVRFARWVGRPILIIYPDGSQGS